MNVDGAGRVRGGKGSADEKGSGKGSQAHAWKSLARTGAPAVRIQGAPSSTCSSGADPPTRVPMGMLSKDKKPPHYSPKEAWPQERCVEQGQQPSS